MKYLQVLRPLNLLIVLVTLIIFQLVLHHFSIYILYNFSFFLICIVAMIITGTGNLVNDIFDIEIDQYNQEKNKFIPNQLSIKSAWRWYFILIAIGLILSVIVAIQLDKIAWIILYPLSCLCLYYYSAHLKMQFIIGNILIAVFCSILPWILWIAFQGAIEEIPGERLLYDYRLKLLLCFSALMFLITFYREIIKDIEDIEGDRYFKAKTLPIVLGIHRSKLIAMGLLSLIPIAAVIYLLSIGELRSPVDFGYFFIFILVPSLLLIFQTNKALNKFDFGRLSRYAKLFMLSGILFLFFHFI